MLIKSRKSWQLSDRDVTPHDVYLNRRAFMGGIAGSAGIALAGCDAVDRQENEQDANGAGKAVQTPPGSLPVSGKLSAQTNQALSTDETLTAYQAATSYNNFYEFGLGKDDPVAYADAMSTRPWEVSVEGAVDRPGRYALDDLIDMQALEERIYRLRCVEAWSMVIPWIGVPLASVLKKVGPTSRAKFVQFETLADPKTMRGLRYPVLDWPYVEALRMDEAANPLALLAVGLYGQVLPNQNGAPLRLVVPWKYGFKSIKSIVAMRFVEEQPATSWNQSQPREYGFYANVNPRVDHPRWSQASERRIGEFGRRDTLMFNGYAEEVADLYSGMDLSRYF